MQQYHPIVNKIKTLLNQHGVDYKCFEHAAVRTSEEAAAIRPEYSIAQGAKALIVLVKKKNTPKEEQKKFIQIVIPGDCKFNPRKVKVVLDAKDIRFAHEEEVLKITDGVKLGGVPPFGNIFGLPVFVDKTLLVNDEIIFNAGDRSFSIAMSSKDYVAIVKPIIVCIV